MFVLGILGDGWQCLTSGGEWHDFSFSALLREENPYRGSLVYRDLKVLCHSMEKWTLGPGKMALGFHAPGPFYSGLHMYNF